MKSSVLAAAFSLGVSALPLHAQTPNGNPQALPLTDLESITQRLEDACGDGDFDTADHAFECIQTSILEIYNYVGQKATVLQNLDVSPARTFAAMHVLKQDCYLAIQDGEVKAPTLNEFKDKFLDLGDACLDTVNTVVYTPSLNGIYYANLFEADVIDTLGNHNDWLRDVDLNIQNLAPTPGL